MATQKANNTVRISAGEWRSRLLKFPDVDGLRPTPDRVRQTVFNWLGQELHGLSCLDLFAGTGVMGFETLLNEFIGEGIGNEITTKVNSRANRRIQDS